MISKDPGCNSTRRRSCALPGRKKNILFGDKHGTGKWNDILWNFGEHLVNYHGIRCNFSDCFVNNCTKEMPGASIWSPFAIQATVCVATTWLPADLKVTCCAQGKWTSNVIPCTWTMMGMEPVNTGNNIWMWKGNLIEVLETKSSFKTKWISPPSPHLTSSMNIKAWLY